MDNFHKIQTMRVIKDLKYDLHVKGWVKVSGVSFDVDFDFNDEAPNNQTYELGSPEAKFKHLVPIVEAIHDQIPGRMLPKGAKAGVTYDVNVKGNINLFGILMGNVDFELKSE
jgi:hypothetical protein